MATSSSTRATSTPELEEGNAQDEHDVRLSAARSADEGIKDLWFSQDGTTSIPITFNPSTTTPTSSPHSHSRSTWQSQSHSQLQPQPHTNIQQTSLQTQTQSQSRTQSQLQSQNYSTPYQHTILNPLTSTWTPRLLVFCGDRAEGLGREDDRVLGFPTISDASTLFIFSERWIVDSITTGRLSDLRGYIMHAPKMFRESDEISFSGPEDGLDHDHDRERNHHTHGLGFGYHHGTSTGSGPAARVGLGKGVKLEEDNKPLQPSTVVAHETGQKSRPGYQSQQKYARHQDQKHYRPRYQHDSRCRNSPCADPSRQPIHSQRGPPYSYNDRPPSPPTFYPQPYSNTVYLQGLPLSPDETPRSKSRSGSARESPSRSHCRRGWNGAEENSRRRKEEICARLNTGIGIRMENGDRGEDSGYAGCDSGRTLDGEKGRTVDGMYEGLRLPSLKKRKQERKGRDSHIHPYEGEVPLKALTLLPPPSFSNLAPDNLKSSEIKRFLTDLIQAETQNVHPPPPATVEGPFITPAPTPPPRKPSMDIYTDPHDKAPSGGRRIKYMIQVQDEHGLRRIEVAFPKGQRRVFGTKRVVEQRG